MGSAELQDTMIKDGLWEAYDYHMGMTAIRSPPSCERVSYQA